MKNIYSRVEDLVPDEKPIVVIETNRLYVLFCSIPL